MDYTRFTLFHMLLDKAEEWMTQELNKKNSVVGNLMRTIIRKGKLRDAQIGAIKIYLWLKEQGNNKKLSQLIKDGILFDDRISALYKGDGNFIDQPVKRFLNRYLDDAKIKNKDDYLGVVASNKDFEKLVDDLFEDFDYPNYLFSLPMGAGKTFLIASFIYIDLYLYEKTGNDSYAQNFIVLAPSAKKTAILPSLRTIKRFNPEWILPKSEAKRIKNDLRIEVLDQFAKDDKLQNQNPNLAKVNRTITGHPCGNVFILNAEKILSDNFNMTDDELENLAKAQKTKIIKSRNLILALSNIKNMCVFLDEAHHSYSSSTKKKKLREQLEFINRNNNIKCCVGMSGTPYVNRDIKFLNKKIKVQDIQDIVYYYPLTNAIGNFLKTPIIRKDSRNEESLIKNALSEFFEKYDKEYSNGTLSKIVFYCSSIEKLNKEVLPIVYEWYDENERDKIEILKYYTNSNKEFPLPKENYIAFLNLDNPTSKHRVVLLVEVGTEGWDCRSLTSVVLPRNDSAKNLVLQTTCRCLREVVDAKNEKALIYLNESNYKVLDDELNVNYHIGISDINGKESKVKEYPVYKIKNIGEIKYNQVYNRYVELVEEKQESNIKEALKNYSFRKFKEKYPYVNQIGTTTITSQRLDESISYENIEQPNYVYSFSDFLYDLEKSTFGKYSCADLMEYEEEFRKIHEEITSEKNISWIINHKDISFNTLCNDITSIFAKKVNSKKELIKEEIKIELLDWDMSKKPTIPVSEEKKDLVYPINAYDDIEIGEENYESNLEEIKRRYNDKMKFSNKEKSFNYLPYRMDSAYEYNFLKNVLANIDGVDVEIYYNGYKNENLKSFKIITPYGKYTPDFVLIKKENNKISKVLIIETKGHPFETPEKEKYINEVFLKNNENYSYIRIGDTENDKNEYNKMLDCISDFAK